MDRTVNNEGRMSNNASKLRELRGVAERARAEEDIAMRALAVAVLAALDCRELKLSGTLQRLAAKARAAVDGRRSAFDAHSSEFMKDCP